jgi:hypothetical protein
MKKSFKALSAVAALEFLRAPGFSKVNQNAPLDAGGAEGDPKLQDSAIPLLIAAGKSRRGTVRSEPALKILDAD